MVEEKPKEVLTADRKHYVLDNLNLVHHIVHKYIKPLPNEYEDCYQEGCVGLTLAAIRFDEGLGYKFSTYAVPMIIGTIKYYLRATRPLVKYSRNMVDLYTKIQQLKFEGLSDNQILEHLNIGSALYFDILNMYNVTSLDMELDEDSSMTVADTLGVYDENPDEESEYFEKSLESVVKNLSDIYRAIYEEYIYSLYCGSEKLTQKYFANKYGISQSHVSRILKKLNKLYKAVLEKDDLI
jgi:RNA polymerase sigma factor (sigma-70 family)